MVRVMATVSLMAIRVGVGDKLKVIEMGEVLTGSPDKSRGLPEVVKGGLCPHQLPVTVWVVPLVLLKPTVFWQIILPKAVNGDELPYKIPISSLPLFLMRVI